MSHRSRRRLFTVAAGVALLASAGHVATGHAAAGHSASTTASIKTTTVAAEAIAYAEQQLKCPYVWGGTGPCAAGFDCSGLVMMAYRTAGVSIARTSQAQWATLPHIPASQIRPGDLIFYAGSDGTVTAPGHVVLYIGNGKVIQAYATGYPVMISSLASIDAGSLTGYARPQA